MFGDGAMNRYEQFRHFYTPTRFAEENLLVCDGMGYECQPDFGVDRSYFDNYIVLLTLEGVLHVEQSGSKLSAGAGEGILVDAHNWHHFYFEKGKKAHMLWFHFRGKPCQPLLDEMNANQCFPVLFRIDGIEKGIYKLFSIAEAGRRTFEYELSSTIYTIVTTIISDCVLRGLIDGYPVHSLAFEAERYVQEHIGDRITLEKMARHFNMERSCFCRRFRQEFGMPPFAYIKRVRVDTAKKLMLYTNDSISRIAASLDFCEQSYFCNVFRSVEGCSPREFLRRERTNRKLKNN